MGKVFFVKLTEDGSEEYRYQLGNFKRLSYMINTPVSPMPIPEEDSSENILLKIEGNSSVIDLGWIISDNNGVDLVTTSETTIPSSTVSQQLNFFRNIFRPQSIDDSYRLILQVGETPAPSDDIVFKGTFAQFKFNMEDPSLLTFIASCKFYEGSVALLLEADVPSEPQNVSVISENMGQMIVNWDSPLQQGESPIDGYIIEYRIFHSGSSYSQGVVPTTNATTQTISGLPSGVYEVRVIARNNIGYGRPSTPNKNVVVG